MVGSGLNPRFDGAFLNSMAMAMAMAMASLNPRFDGAFLNSNIVLNLGGFKLS